MSRQIITLTTDFGDKSGYVGVMKGVIYTRYHDALVIDLSHAVHPQNIREAAFLIYTSYRYFATNTIHVAVVDPGVGSDRRALCLQVPEIGSFIGPDNGLFSYIIESYPKLKAYEISNPAFMQLPVSNTFHGRDIFAPTAALIARGEAVATVGTLLDNSTLVRLEDLWPQWQKDDKKREMKLRAKVVHIDQFGNLVTNIPQKMFEEFNPAQLAQVKVKVSVYYSITGLQQTYADSKAKQIIALFGSSGFLEIARVNGSAANMGDTVIIKPDHEVRVKIRF